MINLYEQISFKICDVFRIEVDAIYLIAHHLSNCYCSIFMHISCLIYYGVFSDPLARTFYAQLTCICGMTLVPHLNWHLGLYLWEEGLIGTG